MNLTTEYMSLKLKNPLVSAASPLSEKLDNIKMMEDSGIAAVVFHSLFEEQLNSEAEASQYFSDQGTESFAEALSYFPKLTDYVLGPDEYLQMIAKAKAAVDIPIIGSLNGFSSGGWVRYAKDIQSAGADALELNIHFIPTDPAINGTQIEERYFSVLKRVKENVHIPVAVKLSPYFSSFPHVARKLAETGADALVLFNRFYQPDLDLENLQVAPNLVLSSSLENRLTLRWIAILYSRVGANLAAMTGIHNVWDVVKMIMAGADVTMMCSALLLNGIDHARIVLDDLKQWMDKHEYASIQEMRGILSQKSCPHPEAFERANYMKVLQSYR
ncbi:MAG: dihydroorotate dehydrogenase 2 [Candidatus Methanofastidiosum methylothiophilum]|uniref:Dihydroorotate dehydrogenase 2 n=1 Tax=Candidatus Methanofastidiosum methylothiophilum TaxID=1705564 RepID=A0A150J4A2_9EURY|nr:MAG: dihydroorotate dehydrogenase 2 [Candidatus Methanofastidiosum methylthiophilus]